MTEENKRLVKQALGELFQNRNLAAIDRYFAVSYRQHNPFVENGSEGLRAFAARAIVDNPAFSAETSHFLADGELVAVRSRYTGFGPNAHVGFDLFRIEGGAIAEHWDCLEEETAENRSAFEAPSITTTGDSCANRALVESFVEQVLLARRYASFADFVADGPDTATLRKISAQDGNRRYERLHRVVADGELVLTQSEGSLDARPHALYDLFRVSGSKIATHWGVAQELIPVTASGLGMF